MPENGPQTMMTEAALKEALAAVRERIANAESERTKLANDIAVARQEERLLTQLLELRGFHPGGLKVEPKGEDNTNIVANPGKNSVKHPLVDAVFNELASAGRPVHISDLMRALNLRGVSIPGTGNQANVISYLRREPQFVRTSRGMYGLAVWGLEHIPTIQRQKRKRVRFTSNDTKGDRGQ